MPVAVPGPTADLGNAVVGNLNHHDPGIHGPGAFQDLAIIVGDELGSFQDVELEKQKDDRENGRRNVDPYEFLRKNLLFSKQGLELRVSYF